MAKLTEAAASGDLRAGLEALRDVLANEIVLGEYPIAPLAKQLADVLRLLDGLPSEREKSIDDELAERRAVRRSSSGAQDGSEGAEAAGGRRRGSGRSRRPRSG